MSSPSSHPDSRFAHFTERQLELNEVFNAQAEYVEMSSDR